MRVRLSITTFPWLALLALAACGPIRYASQVTARASQEVEAAEGAHAIEVAPYELTMSQEYLHKAREEAGESRWERALDYGAKSEQFGKAAQAKTVDPSAVPPAAPAATTSAATTTPAATMPSPEPVSGNKDAPKVSPK